MHPQISNFPALLAEVHPLVSVIIPSFNKARFLPESIGSALSQTHGNIEVVVVNDGSTDDTSAVVRALQNQYSDRKIVLLEKPNGGISDARNFAIERCASGIVCCLDGDDIMLPEFIASGLVAMRQHNANLICCNVELFGSETGEWKPKPYAKFDIRYNNDIPTLVMYDKELWRKAGGYSRALPFNEDWEFFVRLSKHGLVAHKLEPKFFRYRVTGGGLAEQFIKDSWKYSVALMATSNDDLYPVEQLIQAHQSLANMSQKWFDRFTAQNTLHQNEWVLKFWLGLFEEGRANSQVALAHYVAASNLRPEHWQPLYRIGTMLESQNPQQAAHLFHLARTDRPDLTRLVQENIDRMMKLG